MADKTSDGKQKRRVKNPETFRQRAMKAVEASDKPAAATKLKAGGAKATGPVRRAVAKIAGAKVFKPLRRPARILGKILLPPYIRGSFAELKLVTWPNWTQSRQLTTAVLIFAVIFGAAIAGVDWGLDKLFKHILLK
ncbi:MAG TPA: preprotein translocase subunit SecE [Candidatus Saccharimonadales bacterium]|nr:preprotein translocase subunit SecE [Candidatus Saccharimonadales bacterium]